MKQKKTYWEKYKRMYGEHGMIFRFHKFLNTLNKIKKRKEK